jgi:hypothetical protein
MEEEHGRIDPLLAAVDDAMAGPEPDDGTLGEAIGELASAFTAAERAEVLAAIRVRGSAANTMEMVP